MTPASCLRCGILRINEPKYSHPGPLIFLTCRIIEQKLLLDIVQYHGIDSYA